MNNTSLNELSEIAQQLCDKLAAIRLTAQASPKSSPEAIEAANVILVERPVKKFKSAEEVISSTILDALRDNPAALIKDTEGEHHPVIFKGTKKDIDDKCMKYVFQMIDGSTKEFTYETMRRLYSVQNNKWILVSDLRSSTIPNLKEYLGHVVNIKTETDEETTEHKNVLFAKLRGDGTAILVFCNHLQANLISINTHNISSITKSSSKPSDYYVSCFDDSKVFANSTWFNTLSIPHESMTRKLYTQSLNRCIQELNDTWFEPFPLNLEEWNCHVIHLITQKKQTPVKNKCKLDIPQEQALWNECVVALYHLTLTLMKYKGKAHIGREFKYMFTVCLDNLLIFMLEGIKTGLFNAQCTDVNLNIFDELFLFPVLKNIVDLNWIINICICYDVFTFGPAQFKMISSEVGRDTRAFLKKVCSSEFNLYHDYIYPSLLHPVLNQPVESLISWSLDTSTFRNIIDVFRRGFKLPSEEDEKYWALKIFHKKWAVFAHLAVIGIKYDVKTIVEKLPELITYTD